MIQSNDLRIGNFVCDKTDNSITEWSIHDWASVCEGLTTLSNIDGIPITVEWLERFGFDNLASLIYTYDNILIDNKRDYWLCSISVNKLECVSLANLKYVHELQNLAYAICGNELKISS